MITIIGIELTAKIRKHQFKVGRLPGRLNDCSGNLDSRGRWVITTTAVKRDLRVLNKLAPEPYVAKKLTSAGEAFTLLITIRAVRR